MDGTRYANERHKLLIALERVKQRRIGDLAGRSSASGEPPDDTSLAEERDFRHRLDALWAEARREFDPPRG